MTASPTPGLFSEDPTDHKPLLFLGAGASRAFSIPVMAEFIPNDKYSEWTTTVPGHVAVLRSMAVAGLLDIEEILFMLTRLSQMKKEDDLAAIFISQVHTKWDLGRHGFEYENVVTGAVQERERLRELIHTTCLQFDKQRASQVYSLLFASAFEFFGKPKEIVVVTTNYDRVVEHLWESTNKPLDVESASLGLRDGFTKPLYGQRRLDVTNGYYGPETGEAGVVSLIKLHGSIGWRQYEVGRVADTGATEYAGANAVIAYPVREDKSREEPFKQLYEAFDHRLSRCDLYVVVGSSLRDDGVRDRLNSYLGSGDRRCVVIDPGADKILSKFDPGVRRYVIPVEGEFGEDISLGTQSEWRNLLSNAVKGSKWKFVRAKDSARLGEEVP